MAFHRRVVIFFFHLDPSFFWSLQAVIPLFEILRKIRYLSIFRSGEILVDILEIVSLILGECKTSQPPLTFLPCSMTSAS
jgi:hypothetical protein